MELKVLPSDLLHPELLLDDGIHCMELKARKILEGYARGITRIHCMELKDSCYAHPSHPVHTRIHCMELKA